MVDAVTSALWVLIPTTVAVQVDIHYTWVESPASIQVCVCLHEYSCVCT